MEDTPDMENIMTKDEEQEWKVANMLMDMYHRRMDEMLEAHDQHVRKLEHDLIDVRNYVDKDSFVRGVMEEAQRHLRDILNRLEGERERLSWKGIDNMHDGWYDYHGYVTTSLGEIEDILDYLALGH